MAEQTAGQVAAAQATDQITTKRATEQVTTEQPTDQVATEQPTDQVATEQPTDSQEDTGESTTKGGRPSFSGRAGGSGGGFDFPGDMPSDFDPNSMGSPPSGGDFTPPGNMSFGEGGPSAAPSTSSKSGLAMLGASVAVLACGIGIALLFRK